jgi:hypothetical protein
MNATCARCGMPLRYESLVRGTAEHGPLCGHCVDRSTARKSERTQTAPWLLDWIFALYRLGSRLPIGAANGVARLLPEGSALRNVALVLGSAPARSDSAEYDVLVLYSGGKDSSYMLLDLARRGLRVCAWMLNQGYQSPTAIENARRLCDSVGVPLVVDRPEKTDMDSLFRAGFAIQPHDEPEIVKAAMTYGSACWPCFATIAARASVFCQEHRIPFCFIGTQAGQNRLDLHGEAVLAGRGLPSMSELVERFMAPFRARAESMGLAASRVLASRATDTVVVPFFEFVPKPAIADQLEVLRAAGWKQPNNTGACSTNCMVNELGRHVMRRRFGFDLYQVIDAHEQRLTGDGAARPVPDVALRSVVRAAKMMKLSRQERAEFGIPEMGENHEEHR